MSGFTMPPRFGVEIYITIGLLILLLLSYIILKIVQKKHLKDPAYQKKLKEREAERKRIEQEERELEDLAYSQEGYDD